MRLPNRESGPQNQPKAKVAVSVALGRDASIGGIAADRVAVPYTILPVMAVPSDPDGCDAVTTPGTGTRKYAATDPAASIPKRIDLMIYIPTLSTLVNVRAAESCTSDVRSVSAHPLLIDVSIRRGETGILTS